MIRVNDSIGIEELSARLKTEQPEKVVIVSRGTCGIAKGAESLVKALSDQIDEGAYQHDCHPMMVRQNKWRAARFGNRAELVNSYTYEVQPVARIIENLITRLHDTADELGCIKHLHALQGVVQRPSWSDAQKQILKQTGDPAEVVRQLSARSRITPV